MAQVSDPGLVGDALSPEELAPLPLIQTPDDVDFLVARGIPERLRDSCFIMPQAPDGFRLDETTPIAFLVGGQRPPRTIEDIELAAATGLALDLILQEDFELERLEAPLRATSRITLASRSGRVRGLGVLERLELAEQLHVTFDGTDPIDFSALTSLRRFLGVGRLGAAASAAPNLRDLLIDHPRFPHGARLAGPVETVELRGIRGDFRFPGLDQPHALQEVLLAGGRRLDASELAPAKGLRRLVVANCREFTGVEALVSIAALDHLEFDDVRAIKDWGALAGVRVSRGGVRNNHIFPSWFAEMASKASGSSWIVAARHVSRGDANAAGMRFDWHGEDPESYPPFIVAVPREGGMYFARVSCADINATDELAPAFWGSFVAVARDEREFLQIRQHLDIEIEEDDGELRISATDLSAMRQLLDSLTGWLRVRDLA